MRLTFLGTGGGVPSPERGLPCTVLNNEGELLMFDCGEGAQRQMIKAKIGLCRKTKIFITHLHGDHVLGIPGLLQTMSLLGRKDKLDVFGPKGIIQFIQSTRDYVPFNLRFPVHVAVVDEGMVCREKNYKVVAKWAEHSVPNLAYAFIQSERPGKFHPEKALKLGVPKGPLWHRLQHGRKVKLKDGSTVEPQQVVENPRPGVKIVYSGDTRPCRKVLNLAKNADLLIHECTLDDSLAERAESESHSTPTQVAALAEKAHVKSLILIHVSARYKDPSILAEQTAKTFPKVKVAEDFMHVDL